MRFLLMPIRTSKQGQQVNIGKDYDAYKAMTTTLTIHPDDLKELGVAAGATVRVRTDHGETTFQLQEGKVPRGLLFVPYGPPTCRLMGGDTDGTGMPTSKGWEVTVDPTYAEGAIMNPDIRSGDAQELQPDQPAVSDAPDVQAWEQIEPGRYMPRRIRGSDRGRKLG